jgi:hypothetical protein
MHIDYSVDLNRCIGSKCPFEGTFFGLVAPRHANEAVFRGLVLFEECCQVTVGSYYFFKAFQNFLKNILELKFQNSGKI